MIERYAAIISTLDGSLEPREGDDFLSWLRSQGFDTDNYASTGGDAAAEGSPDGDDGVERNSDGAKRRADVEAFLSAAAARLNALVADKEESLFGDRGEEAVVEGDGDDADEKEKTISPNMSDEDLYQVRARGGGGGGDGKLHVVD